MQNHTKQNNTHTEQLNLIEMSVDYTTTVTS